MLLLAVVAILAAMIASVAGFGIGSLLTPALAIQTGMGVAVAAVSLPHFVATVVRAWRLRDEIDWSFLRTFGVTSAVGSLVGAGIAVIWGASWLGFILGGLMLFVGSMGLLGLTSKFVLPEKWTLLGGLVSGIFGGLVGNQGGVRSAAMLGSDLKKEAFVATATATGVIVDLARLPVYCAVYARELPALWREIGVMTVGVLIGTFLGVPVLKRIPEATFRKVVSGIIWFIGLFVLYRQVSSA